MAHTRFFGGEILPWPRATALVVDTDPIYVRGVASLLRDHGYSVLEATSFQEGRRLWDAEHPQILVADIRLGSFNGLQLLIRARADRSDLSAVITSPVADKVLAEEARRFGGSFFVKPVEPKRLLDALARGVSVVEEFADAILGQPFGGLDGPAPKLA